MRPLKPQWRQNLGKTLPAGCRPLALLVLLTGLLTVLNALAGEPAKQAVALSIPVPQHQSPNVEESPA
jgi:hypothetical protein